MKTETSKAATPRPWSINPTTDIGDWFIGTVNIGICECQSGDLKRDEANAALIVHCCNHYDEMLTMLMKYDELLPTPELSELLDKLSAIRNPSKPLTAAEHNAFPKGRY